MKIQSKTSATLQVIKNGVGYSSEYPNKFQPRCNFGIQLKRLMSPVELQFLLRFSFCPSRCSHTMRLTRKMHWELTSWASKETLFPRNHQMSQLLLLPTSINANFEMFRKISFIKHLGCEFYLQNEELLKNGML